MDKFGFDFSSQIFSILNNPLPNPYTPIYIYGQEFLVSFTIRGILPLVELLFVGPYLYIRPVWFLVQAIPVPMENGIQFLGHW